MPRVLYLARTCPPLEPPFPLPPPKNKKPPATATQQQHVDLDDPSSPSSLPPPDPSHDESDYDYESDSCPSSPEYDGTYPEGYRYGVECFDSCSEDIPTYANIALEHYNSQDKHQIKYQLVKAIVSNIIRCDGAYYHLNFTAKSTLENSKEEFFFAELQLDIVIDAWVLVSIVALEEKERIGGFGDLLCKGGVDPRHCFGCGDVVKHPVDGSLYGGGHYLVDNCLFHKYIEVLPETQPGDAQD